MLNPPTPALVLSVGRLAGEVAMQVEHLYLHGNPRRAAVTHFLALVESESEGMSLAKVGDPQGFQNPAGLGRREYYERALAAAPRLKAALEAAFHDLHTHERLIEAGLGEVDSTTLNFLVIVLADLREPAASASLFPLLCLLQNMLAHDPQAIGYLLLSVASFARALPRDAVRRPHRTRAELSDETAARSGDRTELRARGDRTELSTELSCTERDETAARSGDRTEREGDRTELRDRTERDETAVRSGDRAEQTAVRSGDRAELEAGPEAQLYAVLKELEALQEGTFGGRLAPALGLEQVGPLAFYPYLFDHRKEGAVEVKDRQELEIILGNFLLALLSVGLAQRLADQMPVDEMAAGKRFYSGAAATALVFDPQPVIEVCAARLGAEFIVAEIAPPPPSGDRRGGAEAKRNLLDQVAEEWEARLGRLADWMERVCAGLPVHVHTGRPGPRLDVHFSDLHFADVQPETMRAADWAEALQDYAARFEQDKLPLYLSALQANADMLIREIVAQQSEAIQALPQQARLYPGGLAAARLLLEQWRLRLEARFKSLAVLDPSAARLRLGQSSAEPAPKSLPKVAQADWRRDLDALRRAIAGFPTAPFWAARLPAPLKRALTGMLFALCWRGRYRQLIELRERCARSLEQMYAAQLEEAAGQRLRDLCAQLQAQVAQALESLKNLEASLHGAGQALAGRWPTIPIPAPAEAIHLVFRPFVVDPPFVEWAYEKWKPSPEVVRRAWLEECGWLADWPAATPQMLTERLLAYGRELYAPLGQFTLEDILRWRKENDYPAQEQAEALLPALARAATPLLRADFDHMGGDRSQGGRYLLVPDPGSAVFDPILKSIGWEAFPSGDPCLVVCCRVRHLLPLAALRDLTRQGRAAYEKLDPTARRALHLFDEWVE